jgi:hypothetical protein
MSKTALMKKVTWTYGGQRTDRLTFAAQALCICRETWGWPRHKLDQHNKKKKKKNKCCSFILFRGFRHLHRQKFTASQHEKSNFDDRMKARKIINSYVPRFTLAATVRRQRANPIQPTCFKAGRLPLLADTSSPERVLASGRASRKKIRAGVAELAFLLGSFSVPAFSSV